MTFTVIDKETGREVSERVIRKIAKDAKDIAIAYITAKGREDLKDTICVETEAPE